MKPKKRDYLCVKTSCGRVEDKFTGRDEFEVLEESSVWILKSTRKKSGVLVDTMMVSMKLNPSRNIGNNLHGKERQWGRL